MVDAAASVEAAGTNVLKPAEDEEDKARMTEEQLLELREALCIMSSRSAVLEEREELEDLKEDRMEYKEVTTCHLCCYCIYPPFPFFPSLRLPLLALPMFMVGREHKKHSSGQATDPCIN